MSGEDREALRRGIRATLMPGFSGLTVPSWLTEAFAGGLASVCVYGENVRDAAQLRALGSELREARPSALVAVDEEGGEVTRLHYASGSPYPGAAVLGRIDDVEYTRAVGERVGRDILAAGFDLALGPIADVNSNPLNPVIGTRSFGADPELVGRHVAAWIAGLQRTGAVACAKHFPGHGDTAQDSHLALPSVDAPLALLERRELPPFRAAIEAGVGAIMTSHILLPQLDPSGPATFSPAVLQGLLRDELGFEGVIVSDALDMRGASDGIGIPEAAVRALAAGCDLLCLGTGTGPVLLRAIEDAVLLAIEEGGLPEDRVADAAARVRMLELRAGAVYGSCRDADPEAVSASVRGAAHAEAPGAAELTRIAESFEGAGAARDWLAAHPAAAVIRVESEANLAVGRAPWGPFAAAAEPLPGTGSQAGAFARRPILALDERSGDWLRAARAEAPDIASRGVLVIGRGLHGLPFARAGVDELRRSGVPVLAVEMGWPEPGGDLADLACRGSSRLVGAALLRLIEGDRA